MARESFRTPFDDGDDMTGLQEAVLELLEAAGLPTETNDAIVRLIADGERRAAEQETPPHKVEGSAAEFDRYIAGDR